nr:single-pass membrane and coiled-coil domain-containing protein 3-like [Caretta caretta]
MGEAWGLPPGRMDGLRVALVEAIPPAKANCRRLQPGTAWGSLAHGLIKSWIFPPLVTEKKIRTWKPARLGFLETTWGTENQKALSNQLSPSSSPFKDNVTSASSVLLTIAGLRECGEADWESESKDPLSYKALSRMSWSDILYPGNPERRETVVRLHQELINCIELNFDTTNELIGALNEHCHCKLHPIKMNMKGTIRDNCNLLLSAIKSIQDILQAIDARLKSNLEPDLYRKLHDFQETDAKKMQILRSVATVVSGLTGTVAMGIFIKLALSQVVSRVLSQTTMILAKVGASVIGAVAGMLLGMGVDLILSAILGAIERDQLEEKIQELKALVSEFKPASKEYNKTILKTICMLS